MCPSICPVLRHPRLPDHRPGGSVPSVPRARRQSLRLERLAILGPLLPATVLPGSASVPLSCFSVCPFFRFYFLSSGTCLPGELGLGAVAGVCWRALGSFAQLRGPGVEVRRSTRRCGVITRLPCFPTARGSRSSSAQRPRHDYAHAGHEFHVHRPLAFHKERPNPRWSFALAWAPATAPP